MKIRIEIKLKAKRALCIGGGYPFKGSLGINITTTIHDESNFIVPGTSLKGKIRSEAERFVRSFNEDLVCSPPEPTSMCPHNKVKNPPCLVCKTFGSPWYKSSLFFSDLKAEIKPCSERPGVAIDRKLRTASPEKLFLFATTPQNFALSFRGEILGELDDEISIGLIYAGLRSLFAIGGGKSRGLGWGEIESHFFVDEKELSEDDLKFKLKQLKEKLDANRARD